MITHPHEIEKHLESLDEWLRGHVPDDALNCFIALAQAGRDVYAYGNPWSRNIWLEDTRYEAADIRNLWPIVTIEDGRPYLIPAQDFTAWLRSGYFHPLAQMTRTEYLRHYLVAHNKGEWRFQGQVACRAEDSHCQIHLTPFECYLVGDISYAANTALQMSDFAISVLHALREPGFVE